LQLSLKNLNNIINYKILLNYYKLMYKRHFDELQAFVYGAQIVDILATKKIKNKAIFLNLPSL